MTKVTDQTMVCAHELSLGKVAIYPAEALYGIGCMVSNNDSIARIKKIKDRDDDHGFIVVGADWASLEHLVDAPESLKNSPKIKSWPPNTTFVFDASKNAPDLVCAHHPHKTIALRVSHSPIIQKLCTAVGPIVSTSANFKGGNPPKSKSEISEDFKKLVDVVLEFDSFSHTSPSEIINFYTNERIRIC